MAKRVEAAELESARQLAEELRLVLGRLKRKLREQAGRGDLTPSQAAVLLRLEQDGAATTSDLARAEGMKPQSMSAIVTSLMEAGLVESSADPQDGRKTLIRLSRKCEKFLRDTRAARQDWLAKRIVEKLSLKEQQRLAAVVELLERLAEE